MSWKLVCKVLKRRSFDFLTYKFGVCAALSLITLCMISMFHFGEVILMWSRERYTCMFDVYKDNLAGCSYQERICSKIPIDVVYTWVNGSDPRLINSLNRLKDRIKDNQFSNDTLLDECFAMGNCFSTNGIIIESSLRNELEKIAFLNESLSKIIYSTNFNLDSNNLTCIIFNSKLELHRFMEEKNKAFLLKDKFIKHLYFTTDISLKSAYNNNKLFIIPTEEFSDKDEQKIYKNINKTDVLKITFDSDNKIVQIFTKKEIKQKQSLSTYLTKSTLTLSAAFLWDMDADKLSTQAAANRFRDNNELKYSLRSLEKFAPWVRRVFIVTNGQIPHWLNLEHPRVTLIPHEDIFANHSHLPTFSSPSIESNIHNIPGLSDRFIYLNDDVFFGKPVWPDDFESAGGVFKIYLTYPVPSCSGGCPNSWIADGYCDKACNKNECDFDGGDCDNKTNNKNKFFKESMPNWMNEYMKEKSMHCNEGCSDNWIADSFCDTPCNVLNCGFDAGDCGINDFDKIQGVDLEINTRFYNYTGFKILYFSYKDLYSGDLEVLGGSFTESEIVRSFSIAKKFGCYVLVLKSDFPVSILNVTLSFKDYKEETYFNFSIAVDTTFYKPLDNIETNIFKDEEKSKSNEKEKDFIGFNYTQISPKLINISTHNLSINLMNKELPEYVSRSFKRLILKYQLGYLTRKGYDAEQYRLIVRYLKRRKQDHSYRAVKYFLETLKDSYSIFSYIGSKRHMKDENQYNSHKKMNLIENNIFSNIKNILNNIKSNLNQTISPEIQGKLEDNKLNQSIYNTHANSSMRKLKIIPNNNQKDESSKHSDYKNQLKKYISSFSFLPWEKQSNIQSKNDLHSEYSVGKFRSRHLLDTFSSSMNYVNRLYNRVYGVQSRKVPAHSAHYFDKSIIKELQFKFHEEFERTSANKLRSDTDIQLPFAYYYFLMNEQVDVSLEKIFEDFDADGSGVLSDRELRVLATRLFKPPLSLEDLHHMEDQLVNCSWELEPVSQIVVSLKEEFYFNKKIPQVKLNLIMNCNYFREKLKERFGNKSRYDFSVVGKSVGHMSTFLMIGNNISQVSQQLDQVRRRPTKFVCLNDDIDEKTESKKIIYALMRDFFESQFPLPSSFELKGGSNEFSHIADYRLYLRSKGGIKLLLKNALISIVFVISLIFCIRFRFRTRIYRFFNRKFVRNVYKLLKM